MNFALIVVGVAVSLLTLRTAGVLNLSQDELEELEAIQCSTCRKNTRTIMAVCGLMRGLRKLKGRGAERVRRTASKRARRITKRIGSGPNKSAASHS